MILGLLDNTLTANYDILVVIERIYCDQFKANYLKDQQFLHYFCFIFGIRIKFPMFWRKMSLIGPVFLKLLSPKDVFI